MFLEKGFPPDWSTHRRLIWESMLSGGSLPWQTFSGNPLQFNAPKAHVLKSLKASFSPVQDLHGYDSPWPPGGGKNKFNKDWTFVNGEFISADGSIQYNDNYSYCEEYIPVKENTDYVFSGAVVTTVYNTVAFYDSSKTFVSRYVPPRSGVPTQFTTLNGCAYIRFNAQVNLSNASKATIQLEEGTVATTYSPYSNICPISGRQSIDVTRAGENLFDAQSFAEGNIVYNSDGSLYVPMNNLVLGKKSWDNVTGYTGQVAITFKYKYANTGTGGAIPRIFYTDGTAESVNTPTETEFTTVKKVSSVGKTIDYIGWTYGTGSNSTTFYLQISLGATASDTVKPYVGQTTTITFPSTVYGGTASVAEDGSGSGEGTIGYIEFDGSEDEGWVEYAQYNGFRAAISNMKKGTRQDGKSNWLRKDVGTHAENGFWLGVNNSQLFCTEVSALLSEHTVDAWEAYLAEHPLQITYPLDTPVPFTVTASDAPTAVQGINTMWTDGSNLTVEARGEAVNNA